MTDTVTVTTVVRADPGTAFEIFTGEIDPGGAGVRCTGPGDHALRWRPSAGRAKWKSAACWHGSRASGWLCRWEEITEVEIRFAAVGDGTRVTVEHRGLPQREAAYRSQVGLWWGRLLAALTSGRK